MIRPRLAGFEVTGDKLSNDGTQLTAEIAVGAASRQPQEAVWRNLKGKTFDEEIAASLGFVGGYGPEELGAKASGMVLDLKLETALRQAIESRKTIVRTGSANHLVTNPAFIRLIDHDVEPNTEYGFWTLHGNDRVLGAVWADRAFQPEPLIDDATLGLATVLCTKSAVMLDATKQREKVADAELRGAIAWGVSYSLRTRAAALAARVALLKQDVGQQHQETVEKMERAVAFFGRAGTLASKVLRLEEVGVSKETTERVNISEVIDEIVQTLGDCRITVHPTATPITVRIDRAHLEDIVLELVLNARDFCARQNGKVDIFVFGTQNKALVEVADNGQGVHSAMRAHLFKMFHRYPASRMGLGLAYAQSLAKAYGGVIMERGITPGGATFVITLPQ